MSNFSIIVSSLAITMGFALTACSGADAKPNVPMDKLAPTKSDAVKSDLSVSVETLTEGLKAPWNIASLPDGSYLITEKLGGIVRLNADGTTTSISGVPKAYMRGQGGLFDVLLSPDFASNQTVYISYSGGTSKANGTTIFKARLDGDALVDGETIFTADPKDTGAHFGGRMAFMPDGTLMLTTGDGFAYREQSQTRDNHLGKILRLTDNGKAAGGNPFAGEPDAKKEIYSYGHRNVQGLAYDAQTERLWSHEHGPKGGDELNLITAGTNYGWPIATFGIDYNGAQISPFTEYEGMTDSVHYWVPSIAPSGMIVYRGDMFPDLEGDILVGGLASRDLRRLHMSDDGRVEKETILLSGLVERIRDVQTAPDGAILVLTDDKSNGKVLRITPGG